MRTLRLGTLNLWNWDLDKDARLCNTAQWMVEAGLDVLCVQEVTEIGDKSSAAHLADLAGWHAATPTHEGADPCLTAVLVRDPATALFGEVLRHPGEFNTLAAAAWLTTDAGPLLVISAHLEWGSRNESMRLAQLQHIVAWVDARLGSEDTDGAVIAGDFNSPPDADTVRWVTGKSATAESALWTDAWCRNAGGDGTTSSPANPYAQHTARLYADGPARVLDTTMLPERRIDYILSRGWRHGRAFSPFDTCVVREPLMSDHYAVVTELLLTA